MKISLIFSLCILLFSNDNVQDEKVNFLIKDQEMAIEIAQIYWEPVYGKKRVKSRKPFIATISNDSIWIVKGTLPKKYIKGGSPYIEINAYSGQVYVMSFGK